MKTLLAILLFALPAAAQLGNAKKIQGVNVCADTPADTNALAYSASRHCWVASSASGGGAVGTLTTVTYSATPTFTCTDKLQTFAITLTGNVTSSTLAGCATGALVTFDICLDGTASRLFVPPANNVGFGTIGSSASTCSEQIFVFDGTDLRSKSVMTVLGGSGDELSLNGSTSGTNTLAPPAVAGNVRTTLPATTGALPFYTGTPTAGDCVQWDGSTAGKLTAAAAPCGSGGGGSGLVLVEQHTASSSASLDFTSCITSTYDIYEITIQDVLPATDGAKLGFQVSVDGGSTYDSTSGHYQWQATALTAGGPGGNGASDDRINVTNGQSNTATIILAGTVRLYNPLGGNRKLMVGTLNGYGAGGSTMFGWVATGTYFTNPTAVNAFRFLASTGNITSGTLRCYGLSK